MNAPLKKYWSKFVHSISPGRGVGPQQDSGDYFLNFLKWIMGGGIHVPETFFVCKQSPLVIFSAYLEPGLVGPEDGGVVFGIHRKCSRLGQQCDPLISWFGGVCILWTGCLSICM